MRRPRIFWQLFPSYLLVAVVSLFAVGWLAFRSVRAFYLEQLDLDLESRARLAQAEIAPLLGDEERVDSRCKELGKLSSTRITVVLPDGRVAGDSREQPSRMESHLTRPEIAQAFQGRVGHDLHFSHTLQKEMRYVAIPIERGGRVLAVLRAAIPTSAIDEALGRILRRIAYGSALGVLLAAALSYLVARNLSRPLESMKVGAERFARGDFTRKLVAAESAEAAALADALNRMAEQLDERLRAVVRQRQELEAVLTSMVEGVIAVDAEERIINANQAALRIIGADPAKPGEAMAGRLIHEAIRNVELQRFVARALRSPSPIEAEFVLHSDSPRFLQAHGTTLRDAQGRGIGALLALNDITRLRRLEGVRREFVANVSHELKTPITSIKGFVETLLDGAMENPEEARRFLGIVAGQAERLHSIIEDLLALSRIEQDEERNEIARERAPLAGVLRSAIQAVQGKGEAKQVRVELQCADGLEAEVNAPLLEQAVVNLIDNAIKYSEPGSTVEVAAAREGGEIAIRVKDSGPGIEKEHLPRLFERFYRVDKARSRKLGGTGLGLAIVKHIAQAHQGRAEVESSPGKGSVFTIRLPG